MSPHSVELPRLAPSNEALVELFRNGKTLACDLLRMAEGSSLPEDVVVENVEAAFNQIMPTEYRADLTHGSVLRTVGRCSRSEQGGLEVVLAAIDALAVMDDEHAELYYDLITARLSDAGRAELKAMMLGGKKYEYQSQHVRDLIAHGAVQELQRSLLEVLELRGLLNETAQARIGGEEDLERLRAWFHSAVTAQTIDEVFGP